MNINQLQYFQVVCKFENISKAAQELHVSQSAVSKSIRELEREFEINLFNRFNNVLTLTTEGKHFLERTNHILSEVNLLYTQVRDIHQTNNIIRIGMTPLLGCCLLPPFYQELYDYDSNLILEPIERNVFPVLNEIMSEKIDVGLIIANAMDLSHFGIISLLDTSLVFCTNIYNPLSKKESISIEDLREEPLVLITPDSIESKLLAKRFSDRRISPNVIFRSDQVYTIQHCINHEIASSFLYDIIVPRNREICQIPLEDPIVLHICLVWKKDRYLHSGIQKILQFAKQFQFTHYHG
ncbi:MAG: LysR family transcriptional regulator [Oscillospiraceae bacterium]|nr:LysR family transcriptional regulator [Oscillospiraceae bacterium]